MVARRHIEGAQTEYAKESTMLTALKAMSRPVNFSSPVPRATTEISVFILALKTGINNVLFYFSLLSCTF
jgi:hypothetical protein